MATPKSVAFHTLGCKLNFSETSSIKQRFESSGYSIHPWTSPADIYILNTCSVTEFADRKCRAEVRKVLRQNPEGRVVVIGCYAQLKPREISEIPGVDLVLGAAEKFNVLNYVDDLSKSSDKGLIKAGDIHEINSFESAFSFGDRTRTFLKVQDGCNYKCSFCTIPQARGRSRSTSIDKIVNSVHEIARRGVKEIVLTGVNTGDFGIGEDGKRNETFLDLIRTLDRNNNIERFRISSIEPNLLTDEIITFVAKSHKFVPHFHIPLQSGSDRILSLMRRRYRRELYSDRIHKIKECMPHCCIGVDVIVGFPGESEEDYTETYDYLAQLDISYLHVFTYSERANTPAAQMKNGVPMQIRRARNSRLRALSQIKKEKFYLEHKGDIRPVLFESEIKNDHVEGFTDNYIKVRIPAQENLLNTILPVRIGDVLDGRACRADLVGITV